MANNRVNMYFSDGQREKIELLLDRLKEQGVVLVDNRGAPSISALFRWLVDEKLAELGGYEELDEAKNRE